MTEEQLQRAAEIHRDISEINTAMHTLDGVSQSVCLRNFYEAAVVAPEMSGRSKREDFCRIAVTAIRIAMSSELARLKEEAEKL